MNAISEYIKLAENPLVLLNTLEVYIKNHLSGLLKSMPFRDQGQTKKEAVAIFLQPEYSLQSLSYTLYQLKVS